MLETQQNYVASAPEHQGQGEKETKPRKGAGKERKRETKGAEDENVKHLEREGDGFDTELVWQYYGGV